MAINDAVTDYLSENRDMTNDLFVISSDENKKINSIKENMFSVNMLKTNVSNMSQKYIEKSMKTDGINVNLGNFTGLNILSDVGPVVHFDIDSIPTVSCEVVSSFESTGLNQSVQHISLDVYVDIYVGNPIRIESINFETSFEIAQTVIIGDIPSTYGLISRY
ncbi:MAG: sporulation protein YunB [Eubacteriales bacterium]|nr:sporulation protein YunB [Eubacteriales bacterium]